MEREILTQQTFTLRACTLLSQMFCILLNYIPPQTLKFKNPVNFPVTQDTQLHLLWVLWNSHTMSLFLVLLDLLYLKIYSSRISFCIGDWKGFNLPSCLWNSVVLCVKDRYFSQCVSILCPEAFTSTSRLIDPHPKKLIKKFNIVSTCILKFQVFCSSVMSK